MLLPVPVSAVWASGRLPAWYASRSSTRGRSDPESGQSGGRARISRSTASGSSAGPVAASYTKLANSESRSTHSFGMSVSSPPNCLQ